MLRKIIVSISLLITTYFVQAQNIAINTTGTTAANAAMLDISSSTLGLLIPRVSLTAVGTYAPLTGTAVTSLLVYSTTAPTGGGGAGYYYWDGAKWVMLLYGGSAGTSWLTLGNAGTVDGTNFLGTTDNIPFNFRVNNQKAGRIDNPGSATYNTYFGYQAGNLNSSGPHNTFIGYGAGASTNITVNNADSNTFVGAFAGNKNTTGEWNTAIGAGTFYNNTTGSNNTTVGQFAMYYNSNGHDNTSLGTYSLFRNTSGGWNTAVGAGSLFANTSGDQNTSIGLNALSHNTTGRLNVATGMDALNANVGGSYNTATGESALTNNISGDFNTGDGYYALAANTIGANNTASGKFALYSNKAGSNGTAVGYEAMYYANDQTTAFINSNVAIGSEALRGSVNNAPLNTGNSNTVVGYQSIFGATTSSNNATLGYKTGYGLTTGSNNIFLGYQAGDALTSGSNNIVIGYDIDAPSTTGSNQMSIGNLIYGTSVNGTGTTLSTGSVGIGTNSPSGTFHVVGSTPNYIDRISNNANEGSCFIFRRARGTIAAPAVVQNGDELAKFLAGGFDGSSYIWMGGISAVVNGAVAVGSIPIDLIFGVNSAYMGNPQSNEAMRITSGKNVGIGTTAPATKLDVQGTSGTTLKIVDGNQGAGKVLTSNATGVASWANGPSASGSGYMVLLHNDETDVTGTTGSGFPGTVVYNYTIPNPNPYSQIILEAEVGFSNSAASGASMTGQWSFALVNQTTGNTILESVDLGNNVSAVATFTPFVELSGIVKYCGAITAGNVVSINDSKIRTGGTYKVKSFRVYGIY